MSESDHKNAKAEAKAAKAYAKAQRPWFKKKRYILSIGLVLLVVAGVAGSGSSTDSDRQASNESAEPQSSAVRTQEADATAEPANESEPDMTSSQRRAIESAENYLSLSGFSKEGLEQQLSSSAGDGFSKSDAKFAVDNVDADWKQEAVQAAENYLDISPMSKDALIEQLSSSAGDGFTEAQARYAANKVY